MAFSVFWRWRCLMASAGAGVWPGRQLVLPAGVCCWRCFAAVMLWTVWRLFNKSGFKLNDEDQQFAAPGNRALSVLRMLLISGVCVVRLMGSLGMVLSLS